MWAEPFPLERSGEQAVFREDGDMLRSTAGGVGVSGLSCRTPMNTHICYTPCNYILSYIIRNLSVYLYLCVGRQETLEWWLRYRRLPSAAARPPWRVWEREWEWAETWCLCPAHRHAPWAPSGPVAHLRTAWQHADRSLKPLQTDTESNVGENWNIHTNPVTVGHLFHKSSEQSCCILIPSWFSWIQKCSIRVGVMVIIQMGRLFCGFWWQL